MSALLHKRNTTSGTAPGADELQQGQLAINVADSTLWTINTSGVVKKIGDTALMWLTYAPVPVTTATSTLAATTHYVGVNYAGAVTLTLPLGSSATVNQEIVVKDESGLAATNNITINASGSNTIDGQSSAVVAINSGAVTLKWTGARWSIV